MRRSITLALLLLLVGCGGGAGGSKDDEDNQDPPPQGDPLELTLSASPNSFTYGYVPPDTNVKFPICPSLTTAVGDMDAQTNGAGVCALLFFTLSGIPAGSTIDGATLRLYQELTTGDPFSSLGAVLAWRADAFGDPCVDGSSIGATQLPPASALVSAISTPEWNEANVGALVRSQWLVGDVSMTVLLSFSQNASDSDTVSDVVEYVGPSDPDVDKRPQLVVKYYPPTP